MRLGDDAHGQGSMLLTRRDWLSSVSAGLALGALDRPSRADAAEGPTSTRDPSPLPSGPPPDWAQVRELFPLARDWIHLASFLLVSHPRPVAQAIERFRRKIDADPAWLEAAAFDESEGRPFHAVKTALAGYLGGRAEDVCLTANTTTALAVAWQGLRIRADQEILTTEHDHYSHHESIRYSARRSGATVRYIALYDRPAEAGADEMVARLARAIGPRTRGVGLTWVHSGTGVKLPLDAVAQVVERANRGRAEADRCLLIVDGVHGLGTQDVDVAATGVDLLASGTHKWLLAPRGTGFLWGRPEVWSELRPTIPTFDPEAPEPWEAWLERGPLPPMRAAFLSPGGFVAYEYLLAVPAALELHRSIGRDRIAARIQELNGAFREGAAAIRGLTLHTPRAPAVSGGISCFEMAGLAPEEIAARLAARRIRTNPSPYRPSYARVAAGIMNSPEEVDTVLRALSGLAG